MSGIFHAVTREYITALHNIYIHTEMILHVVGAIYAF